MSTIYVRAKEGRIASSDEAGKTRIPHDRYVPVKDSRWIRRLLEVYGDIELKPNTGPAPVSASSVSSVSSDASKSPVKPTKVAKSDNA